MAELNDRLGTQVLFDLVVDVGVPQDLRSSRNEGRLIYNARGGVFEGERMRGQVQPVIGDWASIKGDLAVIDVRLRLLTDDGATIIACGHSEQQLDDELVRAMEKGLQPPNETYAVHVAFTFETADPLYTWLNTVTATASGWRTERGMEFRFLQNCRHAVDA